MLGKDIVALIMRADSNWARFSEIGFLLVMRNTNTRPNILVRLGQVDIVVLTMKYKSVRVMTDHVSCVMIAITLP